MILSIVLLNEKRGFCGILRYSEMRKGLVGVWVSRESIFTHTPILTVKFTHTRTLATIRTNLGSLLVSCHSEYMRFVLENLSPQHFP